LQLPPPAGAAGHQDASEAVQVGKDGTRPAGSAPASLTTGRAFIRRFSPESWDGEAVPRTLTSPGVFSCSGALSNSRGPRPGEQAPPAAAGFAQFFLPTVRPLTPAMPGHL